MLAPIGFTPGDPGSWRDQIAWGEHRAALAMASGDDKLAIALLASTGTLRKRLAKATTVAVMTPERMMWTRLR